VDDAVRGSREKPEMVDHESPEQRDEQAQEEWYESTRYQILLFVVGIAIFGLVLGFVPN
jgi:hypothetical protein